MFTVGTASLYDKFFFICQCVIFNEKNFIYICYINKP